MGKVAVIGLGNVLAGDDGFGPYVVRLFGARYDGGPDVEAVDLGTPGVDLAPHIEGLSALVVVDSVNSDGPPGTLKIYDKDALLSRPAPPRTNPHQPGVKETLLRLEVENTAPSHVLLVGVVPQIVETSVGLSDPVRAAADKALEAIAAELERMGYDIRRREPEGDPDIWWERAPAGSRR